MIQMECRTFLSKDPFPWRQKIQQITAANSHVLSAYPYQGHRGPWSLSQEAQGTGLAEMPVYCKTCSPNYTPQAIQRRQLSIYHQMVDENGQSLQPPHTQHERGSQAPNAWGCEALVLLTEPQCYRMQGISFSYKRLSSAKSFVFHFRLCINTNKMQ